MLLYLLCMKPIREMPFGDSSGSFGLPMKVDSLYRRGTILFSLSLERINSFDLWTCITYTSVFTSDSICKPVVRRAIWVKNSTGQWEKLRNFVTWLQIWTSLNQIVAPFSILLWKRALTQTRVCDQFILKQYQVPRVLSKNKHDQIPLHSFIYWFKSNYSILIASL